MRPASEVNKGMEDSNSNQMTDDGPPPNGKAIAVSIIYQNGFEREVID